MEVWITLPGFQPGDHVHLQVICRQEDHGNGFPLPRLPQQIQSAAVREIHVQNQQVKFLLRQHFPRLRKRPGQGDRHIRVLQRQLNAPAQRRVVFQQ